MRHVYTIMLALLLGGIAVQAQEADYQPFVEDGKSWVVTSSYAHGWWAPFMVECYYIDGDTLVGSQPCKKLMLRTNDLENKSVTTSLHRRDRGILFISGCRALPF